MTHAGQLRPLFPKSGSQTRPEPFKIEVLGVTEKAKQESDDARWAKKGAGKKKKKIGDRSAAQRARRQRELAEQIEELLQAKGRKNIGSRPQTLRKKVEEAERRLEFDAVCVTPNYSTHGLTSLFSHHQFVHKTARSQPEVDNERRLRKSRQKSTYIIIARVTANVSAPASCSTPAPRTPSTHRPVPTPTPMHSLAAHQFSPIPPAPLPVQSSSRDSSIHPSPSAMRSLLSSPPRSNAVDMTDSPPPAPLLRHHPCESPRGEEKSPSSDQWHQEDEKTRGKEKVKAPDENEPAGLYEDIPDSSDEAGHGLAPIPAAYTEQAAFLAAPMLSNFGFQLDPALEPSFPPGAGYENLDEAGGKGGAQVADGVTVEVKATSRSRELWVEVEVQLSRRMSHFYWDFKAHFGHSSYVVGPQKAGYTGVFNETSSLRKTEVRTAPMCPNFPRAIKTENHNSGMFLRDAWHKLADTMNEKGVATKLNEDVPESGNDGHRRVLVCAWMIGDNVSSTSRVPILPNLKSRYIAATSPTTEEIWQSGLSNIRSPLVLRRAKATSEVRYRSGLGSHRHGRESRGAEDKAIAATQQCSWAEQRARAVIKCEVDGV
ncbi:hypothetical protein DFH09DRAFT_1280356 [Mycena vulgaris]|nr:hypothetical protein DFH09DRAFT_1280356 [Mycena vulgaris]